MSLKYSFNRFILISIVIFSGCSSSPQNNKTASTEQSTVRDTAQKPANTLQKPTEGPDKTLNTTPTNGSPDSVKTVEKPYPVKSKPYTPPSGPTGYITRENVALHREPAAASPESGKFKIYEEVIILETKMTDEAGATHNIPQWYKVQRKDKTQGWVIAKSLSVN